MFLPAIAYISTYKTSNVRLLYTDMYLYVRADCFAVAEKLMGEVHHLDIGNDRAFIDFKATNGGHFECIRTSTVQEIMASVSN